MPTIFNSIAEKIFKKKEKVLVPSFMFAVIRASDHSRREGIFDEFNDVIEIYENAQVVQEYPYSKEIADAIKEVYEIPLVNEKDIEKDIVFEEVAGFGEVRL